jgi:hypothetical protein
MGKDAHLTGTYETASSDPYVIRSKWQKIERALQRSDRPEIRARAGLPPNVGVVLGASGLVVVDADTPSQVQSWLRLCVHHRYEPGPATVQSPGSLSQKHFDGGHWYFSIPEDISRDEVASCGINLKFGMDESEDPAYACLMSGKSYTVVPPSVREEGPYVGDVEGDIPVLPEFLAEVLRNFLAAKKAKRQRRQSDIARPGSTSTAAEWKWFNGTPWESILPEGWEQTGIEQDGCVVYRHPDATTMRSAVAHAPGCTHLPGDVGRTPPMTFFTTTLPEWITDALGTTTEGASVSKLKLYAFRHFGGDVGMTRKMLGLNNSGASHPTPPVIPAPTQSHRTDGNGKKVFVPRIIPRAPLPEKTECTPVPDKRESVAADTGDRAAEPGPVMAPLPIPEGSENTDRVHTEFEDVDPAAVSVEQWEPIDYAGLASSFVIAHAAATDPDLWDHLQERETEAGRWAGKDSEPEKWRPEFHEIRTRRMDLLAIEHFSTVEMANAIGVAPYRARALLRALIPVMADQGITLRERCAFDPFRYQAPASTPEETRWAAWKSPEFMANQDTERKTA